MKVILKTDVKGLGKKGATLEVADGYARNYLFPRDLAAEASAGALRSLDEAKQAVQRKADREVQAAKNLKAKLEGRPLRVKARVGEGGRLFGSITTKDIAEAITRQVGGEFDKRRVELKDPIKSLGTHPVTVRLGHDVTVTVDVVVESE